MIRPALQNVTGMSPPAAFKWTPKKGAVAVALAEGLSYQAAAEAHGVTKRTVCRWAAAAEFSAEVNRLSQMLNIARRAERMRIATRAVRQKVRADGTVDTERDLLDWLKFARDETAGVKLDLVTLAAAAQVVGC